MQKLSILNTREKKKIITSLKQAYGFSGRLKGNLLLSPRQEVFLLTGSSDIIKKGEEKQLRIDKVGLYLGRMVPEGIRLSIEATQLIGPSCSKRILVINDEQLKAWVKGQDLVIDDAARQGFFLVKHNNDFLGCAKIRNNKAHNLIATNRRIKTLNR